MVKRTIIILVTGILIGGAAGSLAGIHQPHMIAALDALKRAKAELQQGEHDKGGHRVKALEFVDRAIMQTEKGIEAGERDERGGRLR